MPSKVPFQVVYSSSSDDNHGEKELEVCDNNNTLYSIDKKHIESNQVIELFQ